MNTNNNICNLIAERQINNKSNKEIRLSKIRTHGPCADYRYSSKICEKHNLIGCYTTKWIGCKLCIKLSKNL